MAEKIVKIRGIDPLLFRDGRPFGNEHGALSARSLPVPMPGTVAGFLRTHLGNKAGWKWDADGPSKALATPSHGPLLQLNDEFVFPAPADAVVYKKDENSNDLKVMCLRPLEAYPAGAGCNLPSDDLIPLAVTEDVKPESGYNFWKADHMTSWLKYGSGTDFTVPDKIAGLLSEERIHVAIDENTGVSKEGMLYAVEYRSFEQYQWQGWGECQRDQWSLVAKVETSETVDLSGAGLLGGEKRIAQVEETATWFSCPEELKAEVSKSKYVRMVLATPAIFSCGWKPGWLGDKLTGIPPGATDVTLKLLSAAVKRREAVSGWDYRESHYGPKATRWVVPAGSVYFFEIVSGKASELVNDGWLKPVNDNPQDSLDGYGLVMWGVWQQTGG